MVSFRVLASSLALALILASSGLAHGQLPVIGPGREVEITRLFAPIALGGEVAPGWTLSGIAIDRAVIRVQLTQGDEGSATLTLHHHATALPEATPTASFRVVEEGGPASQAARAALIARLVANDGGTFWGLDPRFATPEPPRPPLRTTPYFALAVGGGAVLLAMVGLLGHRRWRRRRPDRAPEGDGPPRVPPSAPA